MNIRPRLIIVTSNYTVQETFGSLNDQTLLMAISRRFTQISFDALFNVRAIPAMMIPPGGLDYMYDDYDPLIVDLALPAEMRALGKRLQPPSPLPAIPEVITLEDPLDDLLSHLEDDDDSLPSRYWDPHSSAIGYVAQAAPDQPLRLHRSNAIQLTGRTTTTGLLSGLMTAAGCPLTPPTQIASPARNTSHRAHAQMRSSASSAHPPSLRRPILYDSEEEERNADVCEDMDLHHRAGAYVADGWLVDDDEDVFITPKRARGDSGLVREHKKRRKQIVDLCDD